MKTVQPKALIFARPGGHFLGLSLVGWPSRSDRVQYPVRTEPEPVADLSVIEEVPYHVVELRRERIGYRPPIQPGTAQPEPVALQVWTVNPTDWRLLCTNDRGGRWINLEGGVAQW